MLPNRGWATTISTAEQLEALGFDMVAVDDHLTNPMQPERPWAEVWTTLAAIAEVEDDPPNPIDGLSWLPVLADPEEELHEVLYIESLVPTRQIPGDSAIRSRTHRLLWDNSEKLETFWRIPPGTLNEEGPLVNDLSDEDERQLAFLRAARQAIQDAQDADEDFAETSLTFGDR